MSEIWTWLEGLGLGQFAEVFEAESITPEDVPNLTDEMLRELGVARPRQRHDGLGSHRLVVLHKSEEKFLHRPRRSVSRSRAQGGEEQNAEGKDSHGLVVIEPLDCRLTTSTSKSNAPAHLFY